MARNYGDPDEGYEIDIDELLERDRRRQARFTREERELKKRVLALVRTKPDRFADAGKRIEAKACRNIQTDDHEALLGEYGAMGLSCRLGEYCEQDIDAMPRLERLQFAEELVLIHWLATDADAAEVQPSPTVIASVPWNEGISTGRMFLRDEIFAPWIDDHDNKIELVPSHVRERWNQLVQDALEVLGASSGFAPDVARAEPELQKLERGATQVHARTSLRASDETNELSAEGLALIEHAGFAELLVLETLLKELDSDRVVPSSKLAKAITKARPQLLVTDESLRRNTIPKLRFLCVPTEQGVSKGQRLLRDRVPETKRVIEAIRKRLMP